ncbi:MAG: FAD synthase [Candidatus Lokiarchaeota archaeon]|nr:FAD synthase [Candidatus Lokiarchaeota archaeon]
MINSNRKMGSNFQVISKKIVVAGTFDILHPGHIFLINQAAKLGEVHVIVATDKNRKRFTGVAPIIPEKQRLEVVKNLKKVKTAQIGRNDDKILFSISEINPDIILLGPDQGFDINFLKQNLKKQGLDHIEIKRLNQYYSKYELNSSSLIKRRIIESNNKNNSKKKDKLVICWGDSYEK